MARTDARGGPQTRARIREVANQLFIDRGFDAVTVAEVARVAGVSSVTVFNHFPTKEDLFLDRSADAIELLRSAVQGSGGRVIDSLQEMTLGLVERREPLSGVDPRSVSFFRTVAESPALVARARQIAWELQRSLTDDLEREPEFVSDPALFAALFISGYSSVLIGTAGRMLAGEESDDLVAGHRARFERLFDVLRSGLES